MRVQDACCRIRAHPASTILMADAFEGNTLLEVCVERHRSCRMACLFEDVDPAVFQAVKRLYVIGRVGELDPLRCSIAYRFGFITAIGVSCWMSADKLPKVGWYCAGLPGFLDREDLRS